MRHSRFIAFITTVFLALACLGLLAGCGGQKEDTVAAVVGNDEIMESEVTAYVNNIRDCNSAYADDATWANALAAEGLTPATLRDQAIEYLIDEHIVKGLAEKNGIKADQSSIDAAVENARSNFESDADWVAALAVNGFSSEDSYRSFLEMSSLNAQLRQKLVSEPDVSDEEIVEYVSEHRSELSGRRSSHILLRIEDESDADAVAKSGREILAKVEAGEDFAALAKEFSADTGSAERGGDVGWDCLATFVDAYQKALDTLSKGEVYHGLVESPYGVHIIKCTDVFRATDGAVLTADNIPDDIKDAVVTQVKNEKWAKAYSDYIDKLRKETSVTIYDMPEGLPYDVSAETSGGGAE